MDNTKITPNKQILSNDTSSNIFFINIDKNLTKDLFIKDITNQIKESSNFDLGAYSSEERFSDDLLHKIFGGEENSINELPILEIQKSNIVSLIEAVLKKSYTYLPITSNINIFILPMINNEASIDLDGVNAFALGKNSLYILINPNIKNWEQSLEYTIPHEYAHLVSAENFEWNTIMAGIVFEGLAENLREYILGGDPAKYSLAISKERAVLDIKNIDQSEIETIITDENYDLYLSYFFGTRDLPDWYGYSLGYWLIKNILEKNTISLDILFNTSPKEIISMVK